VLVFSFIGTITHFLGRFYDNGNNERSGSMAELLTVTSENFEAEVLQSELPVLVDFWAPWCGPCRVISPIVEEMASTYEGKLTVGKLNVDDHPSIAQKYNITGIPALLFFKDGGVANTVVGAVPKAVLQQNVDKVINPA
jgi:thioredoxin 1